MFNKESRFTKIDLFIVIFCFIGAVLSGAAFWGAYNNTLERQNEEPIGTIIFQYRVAQRRFIDRNAWDRLRLASPIYNGDTIRTVEQAEAVVIFGDQVTYISLGESTMIQIFFDNLDGAQIDFYSGNLDVASEHTNILITSGTSSIVVGGQARMGRNEEGFVLAVLEGQANFDGAEMEAGSILALDQDGEVNTNPIIAMTSFGPSASVLGIHGETTPVVFSWNDFYFTPDTHVIVEIAADRRFNRIVETRYVHNALSVSIPLENGNYWWRAFPASAVSRQPASRFYPSGTLEVIPVSQANLLSPSHAAELLFSTEPHVSFSWSAVEGASSYLLEISSQEDMSRPAVSRRVESSPVTQTGLDFGRWYWRVTPVFPRRFRGPVIPSATGEFSIVRGQAPVVTIPHLPPVIFGGYIVNWEDLDAETTLSNNRVLWRITQFLNTNREYRMLVEGHANSTINPANIAARIQEQTRELLPMSEIRARAVVELLVELGVDPNQLEYRGIGGERPIAAWEDVRSWWRNRRVEFIVLE